MSVPLPEPRASHADRDRAVETLRTAAGDGRISPDELDARLERALTARTQGELTVLLADLPPEPTAKDTLVVEQTGGKWSRSGPWTVPHRITVRTQSCRVTLDFTEAVATSPVLQVELDMQFGKLVIVGAPGIVLDTDGLTLTYAKVKRHGAGAVSDPRLRIELTGTLKHSRVIERRP